MARTSNPPTLGSLPVRAEMFDQSVTEDDKLVKFGQLTKVWIDWWNGVASLAARPVETLYASASADLVLSAAMASVADMTVTLKRNGVWLILVNATFTADAASGGVQAQLEIAGSPYGSAMQSNVIGTYDKSRSWRYANVGNNVVQVQAKKNGGAGVSTAYAGSSDITAIFLG